MVRSHRERRPGSARLLGSLAFVGVLLVGCGTPDAPTPAFSGDFTEFPLSVGAEIIAPSDTPPPEPATCGPWASLRPGPPNVDGALAEIRARGAVVVAVDQNTNLFSFRDPTTGTLTGFAVDLAREVARDLLGDPTKVEFRPLGADDGAALLAHGDADMILRPSALTCDGPQDVAFSTVYLDTPRRLVVRDGSGISGPEDLARRRVCTHHDPASISALTRIAPKATILAVPDWDDCLMAIQQRQVDAVAGGAVLAGLVSQDPNLEIVGPVSDSAHYAIGVAPGNDDLVRSVNGTLERVRADGTWTALYDRWLSPLGPAPEPPAAEYRD
ncbi:MAG: glutamate ABC transporter substrate-binding protein [Rhodococcus sp. (in: high G+C Gram-positive bacteria)]|nr:MAG: glutamate ABC transporter substrate-binding protein [Rhodococcus sp. (in: high G+C Gram-positive bacteria)]